MEMHVYATMETYYFISQTVLSRYIYIVPHTTVCQQVMLSLKAQFCEILVPGFWRLSPNQGLYYRDMTEP